MTLKSVAKTGGPRPAGPEILIETPNAFKRRDTGFSSDAINVTSIRLPAELVSVILTQPLRNAGRMIGWELLNELDDSAGSGFPAL